MRNVPEDLQQKADEILENISETTPGNRLMLCVLEDAIVSFMRGVTSSRPEHRRHYHEVDRWMRSDDAAWPFAFLNVCSTLGIDPKHIRASLQLYEAEFGPPRVKRDASRYRNPRTRK